MATAQIKVSFQSSKSSFSVEVGEQLRLSNFKEERAVTTIPSVLTLFSGADMDKITLDYPT